MEDQGELMVTRESIQRARMRAAEAHAALLGDKSACVMAKSGESFPAGKFWEGQTAALGDLMRSPTDDFAAEAERLHVEWSRRPVHGNAREAESYRRGGLEALTAFMDISAQQ